MRYSSSTSEGIRASRKKADAGAQIVFGANDAVVDAKKGFLNRVDRGIIDFETGEGFHGIIAFDENGDGTADGHTYIVGPNGEIPLNAQLNGSPDHGIVNICGPEGCQ